MVIQKVFTNWPMTGHYSDYLAIKGQYWHYLHIMSNGLPLRQDVSQGFGAQDVPQGGGGQQLCRAGIIIHIGHCGGGVSHLILR